MKGRQATSRKGRAGRQQAGICSRSPLHEGMLHCSKQVCAGTRLTSQMQGSQGQGRATRQLAGREVGQALVVGIKTAHTRKTCQGR